MYEKLDLPLDFIMQDNYKYIKEINERKPYAGKKLSQPYQTLKWSLYKVKVPNNKLSKNKASTSKLQKSEPAISPNSKICILTLDKITTISNLACEKGYK